MNERMGSQEIEGTLVGELDDLCIGIPFMGLMRALALTTSVRCTVVVGGIIAEYDDRH